MHLFIYLCEDYSDEYSFIQDNHYISRKKNILNIHRNQENTA